VLSGRGDGSSSCYQTSAPRECDINPTLH
jgi:hypothetical protein